MNSFIRLFLILITISFILFAWITHQLGNPRVQLLILILIGFGFLSFLLMNLLERQEAKKRRKERESKPSSKLPPDQELPKRSEVSYSLKEKKSGITWGGGNIRASEATRGTKRKFLGKR